MAHYLAVTLTNARLAATGQMNGNVYFDHNIQNFIIKKVPSTHNLKLSFSFKKKNLTFTKQNMLL